MMTMLVGLLLAAAPPAKDDPQARAEAIKAELAKVQGEWLVVSSESQNGHSFATEDRLVITCHRFICGGGHGCFWGTIEINPKASPKTCDLLCWVWEEKKQVRVRCIYEWDGGRLKLACPTTLKQERPTSFNPEKGFEIALFKQKNVGKKE
jgi:uncharacterized protein (TIGR03067 family)